MRKKLLLLPLFLLLACMLCLPAVRADASRILSRVTTVDYAPFLLRDGDMQPVYFADAPPLRFIKQGNALRLLDIEDEELLRLVAGDRRGNVDIDAAQLYPFYIVGVHTEDPSLQLFVIQAGYGGSFSVHEGFWIVGKRGDAWTVYAARDDLYRAAPALLTPADRIAFCDRIDDMEKLILTIRAPLYEA
ncbi:MAG: hypothetical protein ACFN1I_10385, partial [Selenomonas artemidis]